MTKPKAYPTPKSAGRQAARSLNKAGRRSGHIVLEPVADPVVPRMPRLPDGSWSPAAKRLWQEVWSSPVASLFDGSDHDLVVTLCRLRQEMDDQHGNAASLVRLSSEIRQVRATLGLSPQSRAQLRITTTTAQEVEHRASRRRASMTVIDAAVSESATRVSGGDGETQPIAALLDAKVREATS